MNFQKIIKKKSFWVAVGLGVSGIGLFVMGNNESGQEMLMKALELLPFILN